MLLQQLLKQTGQIWVLRAEIREPCSALLLGQGECVVQIGTDFLPLFRADRRHRFLTFPSLRKWCDGGRYVPSPIGVEQFVQRSLSSPRFHLMRSHKRTSNQQFLLAPVPPSPVRPTLR